MQLTIRRALAVALVCSSLACSGDEDVPAAGGDTTGAGGVTDVAGTGSDGLGAEGDALMGDAASLDDDTGAAGDTGGSAGEDAGDTSEPEFGFDYPCIPLSVEACVTGCGSAGKHKCLKQWGPCVPPKEFCGNCVDDDCDGQVNEDCPPNPECSPVTASCPTSVISVTEGVSVDVGTTLHLSGSGSVPAGAPITSYTWSVEAPPGSLSALSPNGANATPTFQVDVAGQYLFTLTIVDGAGMTSCAPAQVIISVAPVSVVPPELGCADGKREGFQDLTTYAQIAACAGGWDRPGITPDTVVATCNHGAGDDGSNPEGTGCSTPDLCAVGWHVCRGVNEVATKSPTGCAGAVPDGAKSKSLFFAVRQPSVNGSVCGAPGSGVNDVFGCGNLGSGLGPDKNCGPLDRVIASTKPDKCGFNEAEPPLGPWECKGGPGSDLLEGQTVTKAGCPGGSCSYDGDPIGSQDKGGVLCCRD